MTKRWPVDPEDEAFPIAGCNRFGLTKREYIAAQIMAGFAANGRDDMATNLETIASNAVEWTEALIEALNKPANEST